MTAATLTDKWAAQVANSRPIPPEQRIQAKRTYMAGAMDVLLMLEAGADRKALLAECIGFGRAIGTPAEATD